MLFALGLLFLTVAAASGYRIVRSRQIIAASERTTATGAPRACALEDVHVVVYTTQWCPVCKRAKAWLQENGIAYEERDVETSRVWASELGERNPAHSIPTFDIEGQVSIGLRPQELIAMRERAACRGGESAPSLR
jgi:glutaredoxin